MFFEVYLARFEIQDMPLPLTTHHAIRSNQPLFVQPFGFAFYRVAFFEKHLRFLVHEHLICPSEHLVSVRRTQCPLRFKPCTHFRPHVLVLHFGQHIVQQRSQRRVVETIRLDLRRVRRGHHHPLCRLFSEMQMGGHHERRFDVDVRLHQSVCDSACDLHS